MHIAVVGMGKIGLPLAIHCVHGRHTAVGMDMNPGAATLVSEGAEPSSSEAHLVEYLPPLAFSGALRATTECVEAIPGADTVVMAAPLVIDNESRLNSHVMGGTIRLMTAHLTPGILVSYKTTLPASTMRGRYKSLIEEVSGLIEGCDFDVVFSPKRVLIGRVFTDLARYPRPVGGLSETDETHGISFYETVLSFDECDDLPRPSGVWLMDGAEAVEMTKLTETTYRGINIGLANQFARYTGTIGINVAHVIEACNSQPYPHIHRPGVAVGGHRVPVYPHLYLAGDPGATIVSATRTTNADIPAHAVSRVSALLDSLEGLRVAVLGATYRGGVKETAFSGVFSAVDALREAKVRVSVHDPLHVNSELAAFGWDAHYLGEPVDVAIVQTNYATHRNLVPADLPGVCLLVSSRAITLPGVRAGIPCITVGGGSAPVC